MPSDLSVSVEDHLARVVLHRRPVNALNRPFVRELTAAARTLARRKDVRVISVTSSLGIFCAGADLKERAGLAPPRVGQTVKAIQQMVFAWASLPQPVVAGVAGAALGGGLEFALAADLIAASEEAVFGFPEVTLGIIPAGGGTQLLTDRVSRATASKWILTGRRFSGREAAEDRVVDFLWSADDFPTAHEELLQELAANAPVALRQAKSALRKAPAGTLKQRLAFEQRCYAPLVRTHDRAEALKAFLEKRPPVWKG